MHFEFLAGVYVGDTVTCTLAFAERDEHRRRLTGEAIYVNQDGQEHGSKASPPRSGSSEKTPS
jgi:acyl dehydratase